MSNMLLNILFAIVLKLKTAATLNYYTFLHITHTFLHYYVSFWQLHSALIIWHRKNFLKVRVET